MPSFSTRPYTFDVDGETYQIPVCTIDDLDATQKLTGKTPIEQGKGLQEHFAKIGGAEVGAVVKKLASSDLTALYADWVANGGDTSVGESSTSTD